MIHLNQLLNKSRKIEIEDLIYLNELLKSGISLKDSFDLLKTNNNSKLFDELLIKLDKGLMIENIIYEYLPRNISAYMKNLLKRLSFQKSLELALSFYKKNKENSDSLKKSITYPLVLLFVSLTALYLFDNYGLDSILNLMESFEVNINSFLIIRIFMKIIIVSFYLAFIIISLIILFFINEKRITLFYILISKYFRNSLIHTYFTEDFISLLVITNKLGYKTKDSLTILKGLENKKVVALLAYHVEDKLLNGESLKDAIKQNYFDDSLSKFISIASYANDFNKILESYVTLSRNKIINKTKKYTTLLQLTSYVVIGLVIIFIYQVLFLPMQAINSF